MELIYFVGVFVIFLLFAIVIGAILYWIFDVNDDVGSRIAIAAIATILFIDIVFSRVLTGFIFSPESYGYTKIETETVTVNEMQEHPESEVVIDDRDN